MSVLYFSAILLASILLNSAGVGATQPVHALSDYWVGQQLDNRVITGLYYADLTPDDQTHRAYTLILDNQDTRQLVFKRVAEPAPLSQAVVPENPEFDAASMMADAQMMLMNSFQFDDDTGGGYFNNPSAMMNTPQGFDNIAMMGQLESLNSMSTQAQSQTSPVQPPVRILYTDDAQVVASRIQALDTSQAAPVFVLSNGTYVQSFVE